jgi:hypothetical protein
MRRLHVKRLSAARALHQSAQQTAATLLQQARQQTTQVQLELAAAREAAKRRPASTPAPSKPAPVTADAAARERLNKMLDEAPQPEHAVPVDGFADTLPARLFPPSTSFGLLQRSSPRSR